MVRGFFLVLTGAAMIVAVGCSDKSVAPTTEDATLHGGYSATNEAPAFGDATLLSAAGAEDVYPDPLVASPLCDSLLGLTRVHAYHFRAVWGHLVCDSTEEVVTNWDGSLELSRGVALLRRVIAFEPATDSALPRITRQKIEWASSTRPCSDGIGVDLIVPPSPLVVDTSMLIGENNDTTYVFDTLPPVSATLAFVTGPYSRIFNEAELAALDTIIELPDGNAISFTAFPIYEVLCPRGSLTGDWTYTADSQGTFIGTWRDNHGFISGYVRGHFEIDADSQHVFYGKWIDESGQFEGFIQGQWRERHYGRGNGKGMHRFGWFNGDVLTADNAVIGRVKAKFTAGKESDEAGFFQGRWKVKCIGESGDYDDHMEDDD